MNTLQHYLRMKNLDEIDAMNLLQVNGIISDLCVHASEVADSGAAVSFLNNLPPEQQPKQQRK